MQVLALMDAAPCGGAAATAEDEAELLKPPSHIMARIVADLFADPETAQGTLAVGAPGCHLPPMSEHMHARLKRSMALSVSPWPPLCGVMRCAPAQ
jgi:hypothetical protein